MFSDESAIRESEQHGRLADRNHWNLEISRNIEEQRLASAVVQIGKYSKGTHIWALVSWLQTRNIHGFQLVLRFPNPSPLKGKTSRQTRIPHSKHTASFLFSYQEIVKQNGNGKRLCLHGETLSINGCKCNSPLPGWIIGCPRGRINATGVQSNHFFHVPYGSLAGSSVPATNSLALLHHRGNTGTPHVDNLPSIVGWKPLSFSLAKTSNHREFQLWWSKDFRMPWSRELVTWLQRSIAERMAIWSWALLYLSPWIGAFDQ